MEIKEYEVKNLDCAGCAGKIQHKATTFSGIINANLDLYKKRFILETDERFDEEIFLSEINKYADEIEPGTQITLLKEISDEEEELLRKKMVIEEKRKEKIEKLTLISGTMLFIFSIIFKQNFILNTIFSVIAYIILGWDVVFNSIKNLNKGNFMDENFLMTIATFGAFYLGENNEAVGVMLFYKIGEYFQDKAIANSRKSIEKLLDIRPEFANLKDKTGNTSIISPKKLKIGDIIIVKAGEKIPVDGVVTKGESSLNTSILTGESLPVEVGVGSNVLSGSINGDNLLEIKVTQLFNNSTISKIIKLVENASNKKANSEKFITKFARYYTPFVVFSAIIVGIIIPLIFGNFNQWFGRALIFLVISCPCALVISVPLTFFSSIGLASREGILIKGGNYLESLTNIEAVVFDKTGTLTKGKFKIDKIENLNCNQDELLFTAQIGEFYSNHPIGKTILNQLSSNSIDEDLFKGYQEISGYGVVAYYEDDEILVGNKKLMDKNSIQAEEKEYAGTVIYIAKNDTFLGYIYISDEIKEDSKFTISQLNKINIDSYMLTGDSNIIGNVVGEKLGINKNNIFTQLLPQDKVEKLKEIKNNKKVIFVGDGINDAPVLALSDIGIAMGTGSDVAIETADVVIMKDEPSKIVQLLKIASINKKVVMQNIVFALGIKFVVMILGIFGIANMWLAIFSDVGVSMLAIINASWGVKRYYK